MSAPHEIVNQIEEAIRQRNGRRQAREVQFLAPCHDDHDPSATWNPEKQTWYCHPCGKGGGWKNLAELLEIRLPEPRGRGVHRPSRNGHEPSNRSEGLTLAQYSEAKRLPLDFLRGLGLSDVTYLAQPAIRMSYPATDGSEAAVRFRLALHKSKDGDNRFVWRKNSRTLPYGLAHLAEARRAGEIALIEGESDWQTLRFIGYPALAVPGASTWQSAWADYLEGIDVVYLVVEPDRGGETLLERVGTPRVRERLRLVDLGAFKDPSGLYLDDPEHFRERWHAALARATVWAEQARQAERAEADALYAQATELLHDPRLLERIGALMRARGYAGDLGPPKTVYVAMTSRLLERPQNIAVISQSASGKNATVNAAAALIPPASLHVEKAGSARALIYNDEQYEHRVVVVEEADSIPEDGPAASAVRSLAADNYMEYDVTEKNPETGRFEVRRITKAGPTGLVTTSTRSLRDQMGTRVLEITVSDSQEQTRAVMRAHAASVTPRKASLPDQEPSIAVQRWLELTGERRIAVPFADVLAELVPATAVRMRRDFRQLLTCIQAIALLYQCQRDRAEGWVVASLADYVLARELLAPIFDTVAAEGVTPAIRQTVEAVQYGEEVSEATLATRLKLAKSSISYRVGRALKGGWLVDNEPRKGQARKLARGAPLPEDTSALPTVDQVRQQFEGSNQSGEDVVPPPPPQDGPSRCVDCGTRLSADAQDQGRCTSCAFDQEVQDDDDIPF